MSDGPSEILADDPTAIQAFESIPIPASELARVRATFVEPPGFAEAAEQLTAEPVLVLVAAFGVGASEFAYQVLTQSLHRGPTRKNGHSERSKELIRLEAQSGPPRLRDLAVQAWQSHQDYLLDLRPELLDERFGGLGGLRDSLVAKGSRLVILVRPDQYDDYLADAKDVAVQVRAPDPAVVVRRHLAVEGYPAGVGRLGAEPLRDLLGPGCVPADAVKLAGLLIAGPDTSAEDIRLQFLGWPSYLDKHLSGEGASAYLRALLVSAAALGSASVEAVVVAADDLMATGGRRRPDERDVADLLSREEIGSLLRRIDVHRDGDIVQLGKGRPNLGRAVLDRLWRERPALRRVLLAWLSAIATRGHPAARHAGTIAETIVHLAQTHRAHEFVDSIVGWLDDGRTRELAVAVLERLAGGDAVGAAVRRALGLAQSDEWATPERLAAIAAVTGGPFGIVRPRLALERLCDLLDERQAHSVHVAAMAALRRLARDADTRSEVLDHVIGWVEDPQHRRTGVSAFLGLLEPDLVNDLYYHSGVSDDWELVKAGVTELARHEAYRAEVAATLSTLREYADDERMSPDAVAELTH